MYELPTYFFCSNFCFPAHFLLNLPVQTDGFLVFYHFLFTDYSSFSWNELHQDLCLSASLKSVWCFNLLNLFFPQLLILISSPTPSCKVLSFTTMFTAYLKAMIIHIFYLLSISFSSTHTPAFQYSRLATFSCHPVSLCFLLAVGARQKRIIFLVIFGRASKRSRVRIANWGYF